MSGFVVCLGETLFDSTPAGIFLGGVQVFAKVNLRVDFEAPCPGNFYQRIFCLIENAAPIFVDVMGTGAVKHMHAARRQGLRVGKILCCNKCITFFPGAHFSHDRFMAVIADTAINRHKALVLAVRDGLLRERYGRQFE